MEMEAAISRRLQFDMCEDLPGRAEVENRSPTHGQHLREE